MDLYTCFHNAFSGKYIKRTPPRLFSGPEKKKIAPVTLDDFMCALHTDGKKSEKKRESGKM